MTSPQHPTPVRHFDVVIAGAGLVGLALAAAVARSGLVRGAGRPGTDCLARVRRHDVGFASVRGQPRQRRVPARRRGLADAGAGAGDADRIDAGDRGRRCPPVVFRLRSGRARAGVGGRGARAARRAVATGVRGRRRGVRRHTASRPGMVGGRRHAGAGREWRACPSPGGAAHCRGRRYPLLDSRGGRHRRRAQAVWPDGGRGQFRLCECASRGGTAMVSRRRWRTCVAAVAGPPDFDRLVCARRACRGTPRAVASGIGRGGRRAPGTRHLER